MKTREELLKKLAKWYQKAEDCLDRSKVKRILKKAKKHAKRLSNLDSYSN